MGKEKENDGNYEYVGKGSITITSQSDYGTRERTDNKARIHRDFKKISHKGSENRTTIENFTEIEEIIEDEDIPKPNSKNIKTAKKLLSRVEAKKRKPRTGKLSKGKGFKIPKEKFIGTLRETYNCCKKEEAEKGEKWTGTRIAKRAKNLLKSRYGDKYDADFKPRYLENKISEIKQRKL